jgi:hypothetical protein
VLFYSPPQLCPVQARALLSFTHHNSAFIRSQP